MAKQGMKRPGDPFEADNKKEKKQPSSEVPVPEIQGKAKHGHNKSNAIKMENRQDI